MRITRPYATEKDFIHGDGLAIGRRGMILIGAPERPPGIIIRFELVLNDGTPVFRGEGKVVAFRVHSNGRHGLEVRFTNLDGHARALVEHVTELRRNGELTPVPSMVQMADLTPMPQDAPVSSPEPSLASSPSIGLADDVQVHEISPIPDSVAPSSVGQAEPVDESSLDAEPLPPDAHELEAEGSVVKATLSLPPVCQEPELTPVDSISVEEKPESASEPAVELTVYKDEFEEERYESFSFQAQPKPALHDHADDGSKERLRAMARLLEQDPPGPEDESDVTPFAPSVIFAPSTDDWARPSSSVPPPLSSSRPSSIPPSSPSSRSALEVLRERSVDSQRPASRDNLLEKLRNRKKSR
jgi:hypothetical protein